MSSRRHPSLDHLEHRPWPLPATEWTWRQSWLDLAFLHYRADRNVLQARLPRGVEVQAFDGSAWIGVVPFRMAGVMRRPLPDLPGFSTFPELNVRTYVEHDGKPGVWFFSLDADSWPIVFGGRRFYGLPYYRARMRHELRLGLHAFTSVRREGGVRFDARFRGNGEVFQAKPGTFEHWAAERYCLYSAPRPGRLERVEVHHAPWPLQHAEVELERNELLTAAQLPVLDAPPVTHFSTGVHVVSYTNERLELIPPL